jgi:hypothetical protein
MLYATFLYSPRTRPAVSLNTQTGPSIRGHPCAWMRGNTDPHDPRVTAIAARHCPGLLAAVGITTTGRRRCAAARVRRYTGPVPRPSPRAPTTISSAWRTRATSAIAWPGAGDRSWVSQVGPAGARTRERRTHAPEVPLAGRRTPARHAPRPIRHCRRQASVWALVRPCPKRYAKARLRGGVLVALSRHSRVRCGPTRTRTKRRHDPDRL